MTDEAQPKPKKPSARAKKPASAEPAWTPAAAEPTAVRRPETYDEPTNQRDGEGRYDGLWLMLDHNKHHVERRYSHGWIEGVERTYYPDGTLRRECLRVPAKAAYPDGPKNEHRDALRDDGALLTIIQGSLFVGDDRYFHSNGVPWMLRPFDEQGYLHGVERRWNESGELTEESPWEHGVRHGVRRVRTEKGEYEATAFEQGIPALPARSLKSLLGKIAKAKGDSYKIQKALDEYVPYESRHGFAWHLVRTQQWDPWRDGWGALSFLGEGGAPDCATAIALIDAAAARSDVDDQWLSLDGWPYILDRIAERGYRTQDDPQWKSLSTRLREPLSTGVCFVRGRLGASLDPSEKTLVIQGLAAALVRSRAAITNDVGVAEPSGARARTKSGDAEAIVARLLPCFGDEAAFREALVEAVDRSTQIQTNGRQALFSRLAPAELGRALSRCEPYAPTLLATLEAAPGFTVGDWGTVAEQLSRDPANEGDYRRRTVMDVLFILATRAAAREGVALDPRFDALVHLESIEWSPHVTARFDRLEPLRDALATLPAPRLHAIARRLLARNVYGERASLLVGLSPSDELVAAVVSHARAFAARTTDRGSLRHHAHALGLLGSAGVSALSAAYDDPQSSDVGKALFFRATLAALAEMGRRGQRCDSALTRFVELHRPNGERPDKYDVEALFAPCCADAVRALPEREADATVVRMLDASAAHWTAPMLAVAAVPTPAVIEALCALVAKKGLELETWDRYFQSMVKALGERRVAACAPLLDAAGDARAHLRAVLGNHLSHEEQQALDAGLAPVAREDHAARVARIHALSERLSLPKVSIYLLERSREEAGDTDVGRSGGAAVGVSDDEWPTHKGEPMEHVLTLDLDQMPDVRARRGLDGVRAIALFVPDRDGGAALDRGVVKMLSAEQAAKGPSVTRAPKGERAAKILVERVMVPEELFASERSWTVTGADESTLRALKRAVASARGRVLGLPFWIQGPEDEPGSFVAQFDEGLAHINTGDMGLIYVFTGGVRMQCH